MKLPFNLIKEDIHLGIEYFEYGVMKYKGYNVETYLNKEEVLYYITSETQQVTVHFEREYFLRMRYGELSSSVMQHIYFNMVDKLED